jgi:hypothetical protein
VRDKFGFDTGVRMLAAQPDEAPFHFQILIAIDKREVAAGLKGRLYRHLQYLS